MIKATFLILVLAVAGLYGAPTNTEGELSEWEWRIVGGSNAAANAAPYQASLRSTSNSHFCGGTVITSRTILTAAHCVTGRTAASTIVVLGTNTLNSGGTRYQASQLKIHANYNSNTLVNDIALVIVSSAISLGGSVQTKPISTSTVGGGVTLTLTGWGLTSYPSSSLPNNLQIINLRSITVSECQSTWSGVGSSQICTFTRTGEGACQGDSGGPLVTSSAVVGIVSYGSACARGYPDVFTRVSSFASWIQSNQV